MCARATETQQTDKHKLVTHNLGDIGKVRVALARRTSTRGNTLLPSTLTLLIGLRVTHSWGCVYVCVFRARLH